MSPRRYIGLWIVIYSSYAMLGLTLLSSFFCLLSLFTWFASSSEDPFAAMGGFMDLFSLALHGPLALFFLVVAEGVKIVIDIQYDVFRIAVNSSRSLVADQVSPPPFRVK